MALTRTTVARNASNQGAGIANAGGTVTLTESTVANNHAGRFGGGIYCTLSTVTLTRTTVSGNAATDLDTPSEGLGGGLFVIGSLLNVTNSTIAGNHAQESGGGLYAGFTAGAITHATFALNSANEAGGSAISIDKDLPARFTIANTLIASNQGTDCSFFRNHDLSVYSRGYNISPTDFSCPFSLPTDRRVADAGLDPQGLRNNGGPTQTILLIPTSEARNAIPAGQCRDASGAPIATDQRGVPRPQGTGCDIGAVEMFQSRFPAETVQAFGIISAVRSTSLPSGQQQGLVAPLAGAVDSLARGAVTPAVNQLGAFIHHARALTNVGALAPEEGSALTADAQAIIDSLGDR